MGKAQIRISPEIIIDALHMPAGTEIKDIIPGGYYGNDWVFVIDSPELPGIEEGDVIPLYSPTITENERYTWDWGKPK